MTIRIIRTKLKFYFNFLGQKCPVQNGFFVDRGLDRVLDRLFSFNINGLRHALSNCPRFFSRARYILNFFVLLHRRFLHR